MTFGRFSGKAAAVLWAAAFLFGAARTSPAADTPSNAPFMIAAGLYYVGASEDASYLISTDEGLVLIDGGRLATASEILANIKVLGFEPTQVKILLTTGHPPDAANEGLEPLKKATGALLYAPAPDAGAPAKVDRILVDGDKLTLGAVTLTAHLTPGCTAWGFPVRVDGVTRQALLVCAPGAGNDMAALAKTPCELFLANRLRTFEGAEKRAAVKPGAPNPFVDPDGCRAFFTAEKARSDAAADDERASESVESR